MAPRLYHISENPNLQMMTPRIPNNRLVKAGFENGTIGRICFAPTIADCIAAAPRGRAGELLYLYIPVNPDPKFIYKPKPNEVPDVEYTHEIWYLKPVQVKKIATIVVGDQYLEQRFLGPNAYKSHFRLTWNRYKRFKKEPTEEEKMEYLKTQPVYYNQLMEQKKKQEQSEKFKKFTKRALAAAGGTALFMLVGHKLKLLKSK